MKLLSIIKKNLKVLARSRGSALVVIFGPLMIILLVGLAFNNTKTLDFSIGVYSKNYTDISNQFVNNLKEDKFIVQKMPSQELCIQKIKEGKIHTCIILPADFEIKNNKTNEIIFYVDNTRQNLVYQVIDSISKNIEVKSEELSLAMTNAILNTLFSTKNQLMQETARLDQQRSLSQETNTKITAAISDLNTIDLEYQGTDLSPVTSKGQEIVYSAKLIRDKGLDIVKKTREFADIVKENTSFELENFSTDIDSLEKELNSLYNNTPRKLEELKSTVDAANENLLKIKDKLVNAQAATQQVKSQLNSIQLDLETLKKELDNFKTALDTILTNINNIKVTTASNIVSPVTTRIEPVATEGSKLIFLFSDLLMLVIMFIGILLSGTLIIMEKTSKAYFRNFTTPTQDETFVLATYLTSAFLIFIQAVVIIGLAFLFLKSPLFHNFSITFIVLLVSISLFVLIGMAIGYLFSTQEGVTMVSISIGAIFLFLSNIIFPLEHISGFLSTLAQANPYVLSTQALKKTLLFDASLNEVVSSIAVLLIYILVMILFILLVRYISKNKYLHSLTEYFKTCTVTSPEDGSLRLSHNIMVKNTQELVEALRMMPAEEFNEHVYTTGNDFSIWLKGILHERRLAKKLLNRSQKEMITILEEEMQLEKMQKERAELKSKLKGLK
ncbi:MAG: ABC transporter permease [Nanoarchaeota archaeon]